ncbi:TetR/AcrR family transcriptional regulator [Phormidium sp. CLA17]|uniref:TetR/AcrR family transcriptional regulator n=1 Tax=Leptolyngbya sp. Cla-17 TaxID=2803751 RepID=UPI0014911027|nr:TetR/AcrR family transcriptional regulator [Leptolyngbya sp. Cla-17]MBM0742050.1 TetR/AcrR family transcriptional regulator [Leptolyngbya sp. Cla-17]
MTHLSLYLKLDETVRLVNLDETVALVYPKGMTEPPLSSDISRSQVETTLLPVEQPYKTPDCRRRNERSHQAILKAAAELLEEKGYSGVCIEGIAARAGVGKQTIYRWWSSKAAVIMEAYATRPAKNPPTPDTGSVQADLHQMLAHLCFVLTQTTSGSVVKGLIAEAQNNCEVAETFRAYFVACRRDATRTILERGIERAELRSDLNVELAIDTLFGPIWYRLLLQHAPLDDDFAAALVNHLLAGMQI